MIALVGYLYLDGTLIDWARLAAARLPVDSAGGARGPQTVLGEGLRSTALMSVVFVLASVVAYVASRPRWSERKDDWRRLVARSGAGEPRDGAGGDGQAALAAGGTRAEVPLRILAGFNIVVLAAIAGMIPARLVQEGLTETWWVVLLVWSGPAVFVWYVLTRWSITAIHQRAHGAIWAAVAACAFVFLAAPLGVLVLAGVLVCTFGRVVARWHRPTSIRALARSPVPWVLLVLLMLVGVAYAAMPPVAFPGAVLTTMTGETDAGGYLGRNDTGVVLATCMARVNATSTDERVVVVPSAQVKGVALGGPRALFDSGDRPSLATLALRALAVDASVSTLGADLHSRGAPCAGSQLGASPGAAPALGPGVLVGPGPEAGRAHDGELPIEQTTPRRIASLARRYQPTLEVTVADRFWPVSVGAVLAEKGPDGGSACLVRAQPPSRDCAPTLDSFATAHSNPGDYLQLPLALTVDPSPNGQFEAFERGEGIRPGAPERWLADPGALKPWSTAQVYFFAHRVESSLFPKRAQVPPLHGAFIALEYWFYYPYNYYPLITRSPLMQEAPLAGDLFDVDFHQGDWEHVDVLLDPRSEQPEWLYMARHSDEGQFMGWSNAKLALEGEHAIIQAAFGGHPSYQPNCAEERRTRTKNFLGDWLVCGSGRLAFRAATTPLVDVARTPWGCWKGHFGEAASGVEVEDAARPESARDLLRNLRLVAGPESPLLQAENRGVCATGAIASEEAALSG